MTNFCFVIFFPTPLLSSMEPRSRIEAEIKMADGKLVKKFLLTNPHFELFRDDQNREKV